MRTIYNGFYVSASILALACASAPAHATKASPSAPASGNSASTPPALTLAQATIATAAAAAPQSSIAVAAAEPDATPDIVVTASRIAVGGFTAPTPTTVIGAVDAQKVAPSQVSEVLALIPAFRQTGNSGSAASFANLRAIGATRTLVMVNGRRHVPTQPDGTFDLSLIPSTLIERTEVVTGGASASWGSDAVAGVINLILKTNLEGVQGSVQGGMSKYGDAQNATASLSAGTKFADGRGRVVVGGEYAYDQGIPDLQTPIFSRPWAYQERGNLANSAFATNGQPGVIYSTGVRRADTSIGGMITNGPLRGTAFDANGNPVPFGFGTVYSNNMIGGASNLGETLTPGSDLRYPFNRTSLLGHVEFDFDNWITGYVEGAYARSLTHGSLNPIRFDGTVTGSSTCTTSNLPSALGGILININNPYIPAATRAAMVTAGVTCISVGRTFRDLGTLKLADGTPKMLQGTGGFKGNIGGWRWNAYYQYGANYSQQRRINNLDLTKFRLAIDAVTNPANGQIVCRSTLTDPTNGCAPLNIFGSNSVSNAARAYVLGTSMSDTKTTQQVAAVDVSGKAFRLWAGDVAVAAGAEWRKETLATSVDANSQSTLWQTGNRKAASGSYDVKEVFGEATIPLLRNLPVARLVEFNGAVRYTDYSSSGGVVTWKLGGTWDVIDGLRFRATRSRDIRAGNLSELFTAQSTATVSGLRNSRTGQSGPALQITTGNPTLAPEKADTLTAGVVIEPRFARSFHFALDYYRIRIHDAIGSLTAQQTADRCFLDNVASFCALVTTDGTGIITSVTTPQLNLNKFETSGLDIEASYRLPLNRLSPTIPGTLSARILATYIDKLATTATINGTVTNPAGQYDNPHWTVFGTLTYDVGRFSGTADLRWYGGGKIDNTLTEGLIAATGVNINHVDPVLYTNLALSYALDRDQRVAVFARINNLFNRWPPFPSNGSALFDPIGRAYRVGVRFKF